MKLKKHGAFLVYFVIDFANGDMSRKAFDMDYSGYVTEHFPEFEREHPRLSRRFADTIDRTYSTCSWMTHSSMPLVMPWIHFSARHPQRTYIDFHAGYLSWCPAVPLRG